MPFTEHNLRPVVAALRKVTNRKPRIVTFSCPDLIIPRSRIEPLFGVSFEKVATRPDSDDIIGWHKAEDMFGKEPVYDTVAAFAAIGVELVSFDYTKGRGNEIVHDLTRPLPTDQHNRFDVLFDCIVNQVFDPAACLFNALRVVRSGGTLVHHVPATIINQGFYSMSPGLFADFYSANGARVVRQELVEGIYHVGKTYAFTDGDPTKRIRGLGDMTMNLVVAEKINDVPPASPIMSKFRLYPDCKRTRRAT